MTLRICPIVEGDGEVYAIRDLINRIAQEFWNPEAWVEVLTPIKRPRGRLLHTNDLERAVHTAALKLSSKGGGAVLVLIDSDGECPAQLGPLMYQKARQACAYLNTELSIVLANQEYEAWFLAAAPSLNDISSNGDALLAHPNPEGIRGAKEWLNTRMREKYVETRHQPAFTKQFDLNMARAAAPSFDKLCRDLEKILTALSNK